MNKILTLILIIYSTIAAASDYQTTESIINPENTHSSIENLICKTGEDIIYFGLCIDNDYHRLPSNIFRYYSIDFENSKAYYFESYRFARFDKKDKLIFSSPKFKQKTIKLSNKQSREIQVLSHSVLLHLGNYKDLAKKKRADEWEKYYQELKLQNEAFIREAENCKKDNNCTRESKAPYIFPPDELDNFLGAFGIKADNDLVNQSFHFSQKITIHDDKKIVTFGGGGYEFVNEASNLLTYIEKLFPKKIER